MCLSQGMRWNCGITFPTELSFGNFKQMAGKNCTKIKHQKGIYNLIFTHLFTCIFLLSSFLSIIQTPIINCFFIFIQKLIYFPGIYNCTRLMEDHYIKSESLSAYFTHWKYKRKPCNTQKILRF